MSLASSAATPETDTMKHDRHDNHKNKKITNIHNIYLTERHAEREEACTTSIDTHT